MVGDSGRSCTGGGQTEVSKVKGTYIIHSQNQRVTGHRVLEVDESGG